MKMVSVDHPGVFIIMSCECEDWKQNIDKVNGANSMLFARNPTSYKGYDGVKFRYCPWCSKALKGGDADNG